MDLMSRCQRRLLQGSRYDYLYVALLALLPYVIAHFLGIFRSHNIDSHQICSASAAADCISIVASDNPYWCFGYFRRYNWSSLVILVPATLWVLRNSADRLFALTKVSARKDQERNLVIPDLIPHKQSHLFADFRRAVLGRSNLATALAIDLVIHIIDMKEIVFIYLGWLPHVWPWLAPLTQHVNRFRQWSPDVVPWKLYLLHLLQSLCNSLPHTISSPIYQDEWDWSLWFLHDPAHHATFFGNIALVAVAYSSQFLIVLFAISLMTLLIRHNLYFLKAIYLRSGAPPNRAEDFIVLDFSDPDHRLGLGKISSQFNYQIKLLVIAALITLFSRRINAHLTSVTSNINKAKIGDLINPLTTLLAPPYNWQQIFPTPGQKIFPIVWLMMFFIVMIPSFAKCLPLVRCRRIDMGVMEFLRQFMPPGTAYDQVSTEEQVSEVAKRFACQSFWPVGDASAEALSIFSFFLFGLMMVPILPTTAGQAIYLAEIFLLAYTISKSLFWILGYVLSIVDKRLANQT
jgi:hypothetical protein